MMSEKKINLNIIDGDAFFSHEISVNFNALQFILDFKNISPRMDPRSRQGTVMTLKHNVVLIDAYQAKRFHELLGKAIDKYEKTYIKIKKPKVMEKIEKERAKNKKKSKKTVNTKKINDLNIPSYLG
tara:strand:+ start:2335 stop:2715 length:381 start_codon:yes stop_codon:yes gene_type:complete